jgi:hypothetical protein
MRVNDVLPGLFFECVLVSGVLGLEPFVLFHYHDFITVLALFEVLCPNCKSEADGESQDKRSGGRKLGHHFNKLVVIQRENVIWV